MTPPVDSATHCERDDDSDNCGIDDATVNKLAKRLCETMEHLDPVGTIWDNLGDSDRAFYRVCVEAILLGYKCPSLVGAPITT
jgi:hypothetical protein